MGSSTLPTGFDMGSAAGISSTLLAAMVALVELTADLTSSAQRGSGGATGLVGRRMETFDRGSLVELLERAQNADGGWGYYFGKASRLEPTCWAALALTANSRGRAVAALTRWPSRDGVLLERSGGEANYAFHGLALIALMALGEAHETGNDGLAAALQRVKGIALKDSAMNRQDNSLQGWSWLADTFSWVEPTAVCLLALKQWRRRAVRAVDPSRIDDAERLLLDRVRRGGGWNYGNSNMLGAELHAYVPTTALALLAMQDRRDHPVFIESLGWLEQHATSETSGLSLSLACVALRAYGKATTAVQSALLKQLAGTSAFGQLSTLAIAHCALDEHHGIAALAL